MRRETSSPGATGGDSERAHRQLGWWALLAYLSLGLGLEVMHALKVGGYLDVAHSTRRLMWTLAHAHGTLLALVNLAFAATVSRLPSWPEVPRRWASRSLAGATLLLPLGFFLAGFSTFGGDPGPGIVLAIPGGLLLLLGVLLTARAVQRAS